MVAGSSWLQTPDHPAGTDSGPSQRIRNSVQNRPSHRGSPVARVRAVARAFKKLEAVTPGLVVGIKGSMSDRHRVEDPERGVVLALRPDLHGAEVQLQVGLRVGRLVARSALRGNVGGASELEDHLRLDLYREYRWGGMVYPDADAFASALLAHMRRRHAAVGQIQPIGLPERSSARSADGRAREPVAETSPN